AIKIVEHYEGPVVHVLDASRAVGVVGRLLDASRREAFLGELAADYARERERRAGRREKTQLLSLEEARSRKLRIDWNAYQPPRPLRPGVSCFREIPISEIRPFIDWTPFLQAWEVPGKYPDVLEDPRAGEQARALFEDAERMLDRIEREGLLE